jgi:uncharacterized protein YbaP (TraB family)
MIGRAKSLKLVAASAAAVLLAFAAVAMAEGPSREEYKAQVEPICKTNQEASNRILTGVKTLVKKNKLAQAGQAFAKAATALEKAQKQLAAVPQPPADSAKLTKWLSEIKAEVALMRTISKKFKAGDKSKATSLTVKLQNNANKANNLVIVFQFKYCKIDPSKYS